MQLNPQLSNLPVYQPGRPLEEVARELGVPVDDLIKLASNENPLGPSPKAIAALLGVPEEAWDHVDRLHPALGLFQLIMDPSDPMAVAPWSPVPETIVLGVGDYQVPNNTTEWLAEALPDATVIRCEPAGDYDGHYCIYRETEGLEAFKEFGAGL